MPIYEYACSECGHHMEVNQRITEDPLVTCPACSKDTLEKWVSNTSFSLKGGGWYADGYGGGSGSGTSKSDKSEASSDAGSTDKKEKPEKKAETPKKPAE